jgi:hypothetical protein
LDSTYTLSIVPLDLRRNSKMTNLIQQRTQVLNMPTHLKDMQTQRKKKEGLTNTTLGSSF